MFTTVGGYVLGRLGRRARVGDTIDVDGRQMRVDAVDGLRVAKVWLSTPEAQTGAARRRCLQPRVLRLPATPICRRCSTRGSPSAPFL